MMPEISLNILDVAQNSVRANASLIEISVIADRKKDTLTVIIKDDGCGMTDAQLSQVTDPFYTTRTTRKVGLGLPFFQFAAQTTGGTFDIRSSLGKGTVITAVFCLSNIDRMPLGDMTGTMHALITLNTGIDFLYTYTVDEHSFSLDTRQLKEILGNISLKTPEVSAYIRDYLQENKGEVDNGIIL